MILGVIGVFAFYLIRQDRRKEALREQMLDLHEEQLTDVAERYMGFRHRLETLVQQAAEGGEPETWSDPRLNLSGLRGGEGLYLRINAEAATGPTEIEQAALVMDADAITRCLGLAPMSVRGLYERGEFLTPAWVDGLREEQDMMALRVFEDQLGRHIQVDAPVVLSMMQADWFLLVLQRGESRRDHPVDVFLWDLRRNTQLLRARIQGRGLLVPVRLRFEGVPQGAPATMNPRSGGATDCSIASQLRALTGSDAVEFESGEEVIDAAERAQAAAEAAEGESAEGESAEGEGPEGEANEGEAAEGEAAQGEGAEGEPPPSEEAPATP
ncbi:MAG: hypothetical protein H6719_24660 [Sandaracinaceae bacterium]|nr:hypothetical protein [Sandaracinaceae bacterium]